MTHRTRIDSQSFERAVDAAERVVDAHVTQAGVVVRTAWAAQRGRIRGIARQALVEALHELLGDVEVVP